MKNTFRTISIILLILFVSCSKHSLPKHLDPSKLIKSGYFSNYKTDFITSPSGNFILVKYLQDPVMAFSTATTILGVYDRDSTLLGFIKLPERAFRSDLTWSSDSVINFSYDCFELHLSSDEILKSFLKAGQKIGSIKVNYHVTTLGSQIISMIHPFPGFESVSLDNLQLQESGSGHDVIKIIQLHDTSYFHIMYFGSTDSTVYIFKGKVVYTSKPDKTAR